MGILEKIALEYVDGKGVNHKEGSRLAKLAGTVPIKGVIVEIGSYKGQSAAYLLGGSDESIMVYLVDLWDRSNLTIVSESNQYAVASEGHKKLLLKHLTRLHLIHRAVLLQGLSVEHAAKWTLPIDMLFIDADHSYEGVKLDFDSWYPFVRKGGIIAFHDYSTTWSGVVKLIDEIEQSEDLKFVDLVDRIWYGVKS